MTNEPRLRRQIAVLDIAISQGMKADFLKHGSKPISSMNDNQLKTYINKYNEN